ncbi:MAG TPA: FGGY-family carbohydrate kinase, partial [Anaerolineae bacterium]
ITRQLLMDPQNRIYSHLHPEGWWMPGGASNTGCEWIVREYPDANLAQLDEAASILTPTRFIRYPLARIGERFPFIKPLASGFLYSPTGMLPNTGDLLHYTAGLEGTAMHERLAYELLTEIGADVGERIYSTGGGSKSKVWLMMRASMLNRQLVRLRSSETAMGTALLAATGAWFGNLLDASRAMVHPDIVVDPNPAWVQSYLDMYVQYVDQMRLRGYLD